MMHGYQGDKEVAVAVFQDFSQIWQRSTEAAIDWLTVYGS